MVFDASLHNIHNKERNNGKWSNPGKGLAPFPSPQNSSYWKGNFWFTLDYSRTTYIWGAFNKFLDFFVVVFKIGIDSWKFKMLLLKILWDDWPSFMISGSNEQLQ